MPEKPDPTDFASLSDALTPWVLRVAATLRVADLMADGVSHVDELAAQTKADASSLARILRYLAARGVFIEQVPNEFVLDDLGRYLLSDHPAGRRAWLDLDGIGGRIDLTVTRLLDAVRTGAPVYETVHGTPYWEHLAADAELSRSFDSLMAAHSSGLAAGVARAYEWTDVQHVVDVGGGTGSLLAGILAEVPHLQGTVLDLPGTAEGADALLADAGVLDRCSIVAGSFFDALPAGADRYLLANVLHDWDDDHAVQILRRCGEAAGVEGRVLIVEQVVSGDEDPRWATAMDLRMLVLVGGKERNAEEFSALASAASMSITADHPAGDGVHVLECAASQLTEP